MKRKSWIRQSQRMMMKNTWIRNQSWRKPINLIGFVSLLSLSFFLLPPRLNLNFSTKKSSIFSSNSNLDENLCHGRYIYIHNLPTRFNDDVLKDCKSLTRTKDKTSMCENTANYGFGPLIENPNGILPRGSWYSTSQFMLEVIFHERMKKYECLTNDSSLASAIFVPFYAGLDLRRHLWRPNTSVRDSSGKDLVSWLRQKPEWKGMSGHDHFLVTGRISRDFRRNSNKNSDWGSKFMLLPESRNLSFLTIEKSLSDSNQFGIPYPTYFHPRKEIEVSQQQEKMKTTKRNVLFSFAGAQRSKSGKASVRSKVITQCKASSGTCKYLNCNLKSNDCSDPVNVMKLFESSVFCLQPPGDSFTRRSIFDSILAGCIPVFFHLGSAYEQYTWHLPKNDSEYSVYIPGKKVSNGNKSIEEILLGISEERVLGMREEVIRMIPRIVYSNPNRDECDKFEDAFDISVKGILERIERIRKKKKQVAAKRLIVFKQG